MGMLDFLRRSRRAHAKSRRRSARPTHRRPRLEPLEERALLSVTPPLNELSAQAIDVSQLPPGQPIQAVVGGGPLIDVSDGDATIDDSFRVAVWTPEMITDLPGWAHSQQWPEWMGQFWVEGQSLDEMEPNRIHELVHMPLWSDPRGGYRTILQIEGAFRGVIGEMVADLEQLDFVDYVKLGSQDPFRFTDRLQESIDALTDGNSQEQVFIDDPVVVGPGDVFIYDPVVVEPPLADDPVVVEQAALDEPVRIGIWTPQPIDDVGAWVESQAWPEEMYLDRYLVEELIHMPLWSDPRGGYRTVLEISPITGLSPDAAIAALEELDFVDYAKLESESVIQFGPNSQEAIDAMTKTATPGETLFHIFGAPNAPGPITMRVALRTAEEIADIGTFMESHEEKGTFYFSDKNQNVTFSSLSPFLPPREPFLRPDLLPDAPAATGDTADGIYIVPGDSYYDYRSDPLAAILGGPLAEAYRQYQAFIADGGDPTDFTPSNPLLQVVSGRIAVRITALEPIVWQETIDGETVEFTNTAFLERLEAIGLEIAGMSAYTMGGWLPVGALEQLADLPGIRFVAPPSPSVPMNQPSMVVIGGDGEILIGDNVIPPADTDTSVREQTREAMGENKDGPMAKMGWDLTYLYFEYQAFLQGGGDPADFRPANTSLVLHADRVAVELSTFEPLTQEGVDEYGAVEVTTNWELIHELEATGLEDVAARGFTAGGLLPLTAIDDLAALDSVVFVRPAWAPVTNTSLSGGGISVDGDEAAVTDAIRDDVRAALGPAKDGPMAKVGWVLTWLHYEYLAAIEGGTPPASFTPSDASFPVYNGRVAVELSTVDPLTWEDVDEFGVVNKVTNLDLLKLLETTGLEDISARGYLASALLPLAAIDDLAALDGVIFVRPAYSSVTNIGATTSQGDAAQRSDDVRDTGLEGSGITVGVISDSYDQDGGAPTSAADDVNSGDLPSDVQVLDDSRGGSDEGRAMLQVVHDVAPEADLMFHTVGLSQNDFADAIDELVAARADVIVDDVIFLGEPMFMDGAVAQAADAASAAGVAYVSAAGNQGGRSYESAFRDSGIDYASGYFESHGGDDFAGGRAHDFDPGPGTDVFQSFTLDADESVRLSFQWDEPFHSVTGGAGSSSDLDIYIFDSTGTYLYWGSASANVNGDPLEVTPKLTNTSGAPLTLNVMILKYSGSAPGLIKFVDFGADFDNDRVFEYASNTATLFGHANAAGAIAVGAAFYYETPEFGTDPPEPESFTSLGGTDILFDTSGNRLGTPEDRLKPDIVGPDGGNTTFFGVDIPDYGGTDPDSYPNFFGTSAAAPHVAGLAALMLQAAPAATPAGIASVLESTAVDMEGAGFDYLTGYGLVDAVEATDLIMQRFPDFDANDDPAPGDQKDDGTTDYFYARRNGDNLQIEINDSVLDPVLLASIDGFSITGSSDRDFVTVETLGDFTGNVAVKGAGQSDSFVIFDTSGNDVFTVQADSKSGEFQMQDAYKVTASGADILVGRNEHGGDDVAYIYDTTGNDELSADADMVTLQVNPGGFYRAIGFRWVYAYSVNGGSDTAEFYDATGDDYFKAWSNYDRAELLDSANSVYHIWALHFDSVDAHSENGGYDRAYFHDSSAAETFKSWADHAEFTSGSKVFTAYSFPLVTACSEHPGTADDTAYLYDSAGDDTFTGEQYVSEMEYGAGQFTIVRSFRYVEAFSQNGGDDWAYLYDSGGNDTLTGEQYLSEMEYGAGQSTYARSFRYVQALCQNGGADTAEFYDSAGHDHFKVSRDYDRAELLDSTNSVYHVWANGFTTVDAYSENGGYDRAYFHDSTAAETFESWADHAEFTSGSKVYTAYSFPLVTAYSEHPGTADDWAYLYDSAGDDTLTGEKDASEMDYAAGQFTIVRSFRYVQAFSQNGGADTAEFYDSAGNDHFKVWRDYDRAELLDSTNSVYHIWALHFAAADGYSQNGGDDRAYFHDSTAAETFKSWADHAEFTSGSKVYTAYSFPFVNAYSEHPGGADDTAYLYDSAGDDAFIGEPDVSEMLYGPGHFSFARSFRYVHAYAEVGSDGDDTAYLYDSPGDDLLLARDADPGAEDWAKLCDEADTLFAMWAHGFDTVYADSGTGDNDTADIGENLDFSLQLTGTWENQI